jgi:hypothetical protein
MKYRVTVLIFICIFSSCNNKNNEKYNSEVINNNYLEIFVEINKNKPEMIFPIEYYKNQIIDFQRIFPERNENINTIIEINNIIPGLLSFFVWWHDSNIGRGGYIYDILSNYPRGHFWGLYTFDNDQNIVDEYIVGFRHNLDSIRDKLMEDIPGNKMEYGLISFGDFNENGITEILSVYLHPPQYEYVFTIFEYNVFENNFIQTLLVPVQINLEKPSLNIEYLGNGFRVLEVLDYELQEFAWSNYIWNNNIKKYLKQ